MAKFRQRNRNLFNVENNCSLSRDATQTLKDKRKFSLAKKLQKVLKQKVKKKTEMEKNPQRKCN